MMISGPRLDDDTFAGGWAVGLHGRAHHFSTPDEDGNLVSACGRQRANVRMLFSVGEWARCLACYRRMAIILTPDGGSDVSETANAGQAIVDGLNEIIEWTNGEGTFRVRVPDGSWHEMTAEEYRKWLEGLDHERA